MGVRFRKDRNKWIVDLMVNGKRVSKMFDTEADACQYEKSLKTPVSVDIKSEANSFKLAVKKYFEVVSVYKLSAKKEKHYFDALFGFLQLKKVSRLELITLDLLMEFQSIVFKRGVKKSTMNRYFITYKHFFKLCVEWGLLEKSPAEKLQIFAVNKYAITRKLWSDEQIIKAIEMASGWLKDFLIVTAHTGMRPIEVCRLTWLDHIDLSKGLVKAISYKGVGKELDRWIPMSSELKLTLMKRKLQFQTKYVFQSQRSSGPKSVDSVGQQLKDLLKGSDLEGYTLYGMRHSFATRSLESGVDLNSLRMLMGHTNLNTTQIYLRYTEDHLKGAIKLLESKRSLVAEGSQPTCNQN